MVGIAPVQRTYPYSTVPTEVEELRFGAKACQREEGLPDAVLDVQLGPCWRRQGRRVSHELVLGWCFVLHARQQVGWSEVTRFVARLHYYHVASVKPKVLSKEEAQAAEKAYTKRMHVLSAKSQSAAQSNYWNRPERGVVIKTRAVRRL